MADAWISALPTELTVKPSDNDMLVIDNVSVPETQKISYSTLKSFFVKTDEATNIDCNHTFLTNRKLYFGAGEDFEIYSDNTDLYIQGTSAAGKVKIGVESTTYMTFYPATNAIGIGSMALNNDGGANDGIIFGAAGNVALGSNCNFDVGSQYISGNGSAAGLSFGGTVNGNFSGTLTVASTLNVTGQINANNTGNYSVSADGNIRCAGHLKMGRDKCISEGGVANQGISFNAAGTPYVDCYDGFVGHSYIKCGSSSNFQKGLNVGVNTTIDFSSYAGTVTISGGLVTNVP